MQPRTLDQILSEYSATYQPSIDYLRQRQAQAPQMVEADIAAANAAQAKAYEDILTGARRRGLGFSGIPLGEQAQYASNVYAPAILAARQKGTEYAQNLENTILGLQAEARSQALARRNAEEDLARQLAATGRGGSVDTSSATLQALLDYLRGNKDNPTRPPLDQIFGPQQQNPPLRVNPSPQNILQPSGSVNVQPSAPSPQQVAPGSSIQGGAPRIQGSGARQGGSVNVNPYLTPVITNVTGPSLGLRVR